MVKLWRLESSPVIWHTTLKSCWETQAHITIRHMHKCLRPRRAQPQNSMLWSKRKTARAQACNARGPSAAYWGGGADEIHILDSNLLLETKGCEAEDLCLHPGLPFSIQLPYYVWTNSLKHLSLKHGFNSATINGYWQGFKIKCKHTMQAYSCQCLRKWIKHTFSVTDNIIHSNS